MAEVQAARTGKPVTLRDVAEAAGVPLSSVSLVVNGKPGVSDMRRKRILQAIEALQYVPPRRSADTRKPRRIVGLVMEALSPAAAQDGFMAEVVSGVEDGLRGQGLQMLLHLYRPHDDPISDLRSLTGRGVDGMIVANGGDIDEAAVQRILATDVPVVLLENYLDHDTGIHAVVADNFTAGYRCTQHLLELGHRRIGMLVGSTCYVSLTDRRRGYHAALLEAGLTPVPELTPPQEAGAPVKGYQQMRKLLNLPEPPTAVYAVSDKSAMGAYTAIAEAGLEIPRDISIIGTDDVLQSTLLSPPLTTFVVPKFELGRMAAQAVHTLIDTPSAAASRTVLHGRIAQRASTAPPPARRA
ncbi:LacI family DNA-binding transcriptional regulator [Streptomyces litchfieldiae]|uniref:LacI family DNA-binding transcriptional regulator n=1 Tax=Streptomyces litchfieldiae TaxID=3075543 RepID=A0ABU2MRC8_9ACTN|nr:LacI family DNA-binding transcriptional regulator [Streptomyces sp. DSM 44938]MDT0344181.1 LacI family DNA-binding transcriptional regulator [Streptomyces sp. DSM 44938]